MAAARNQNSFQRLRSNNDESGNELAKEVLTSVIEEIDEDNKEQLLDESKSSDQDTEQQYEQEEDWKSHEEIRLEQLYQKFETDPSFKKSTNDFTQKLKTHFRNQDNSAIECTSFINTVHNLFTQHIGKFSKKNKYADFDTEINEEYFWYILKTINESGIFVGKIFEYWRKSGCRTHQDMYNY